MRIRPYWTRASTSCGSISTAVLSSASAASHSEVARVSTSPSATCGLASRASSRSARRASRLPPGARSRRSAPDNSGRARARSSAPTRRRRTASRANRLPEVAMLPARSWFRWSAPGCPGYRRSRHRHSAGSARGPCEIPRSENRPAFGLRLSPIVVTIRSLECSQFGGSLEPVGPEHRSHPSGDELRGERLTAVDLVERSRHEIRAPSALPATRGSTLLSLCNCWRPGDSNADPWYPN